MINYRAANKFEPRVAGGSPLRMRVSRADFLSIAHDVAPLCDFITVSLAGYSCALLYCSLNPSHVAAFAFEHSAGRIALFGGLMAAVVTRQDRSRTARGFGNSSMASLFGGAAQRVLLLTCLLLSAGFLTRILDSVPRLWVLAWALSSLLIVAGGRVAFAALLHGAMHRGVFADRIAIIGSDAQQLLNHFQQDQFGRGIQVVGVFGDPDDDPWNEGSSLDRLFRLAQQGAIDRVILALPSSREGRIVEIVERLKVLDIEASFLPALPGLKDLTARIGHVADATVIVLSPRAIRQWGLLAKSVLDGAVACVTLLLLAPLLAAIAVAIRLDSPGPVIFRQLRHGRNNTEFMIYKFRTMTHICQPASEAVLQQTSRGDPRLTRVGRFLRKTSLDELPQLFNVLNGTMSLVGPRPHAVVMRTEDLLCEQIVAEYAQRHRIKPGITGWAQINGHRGATDTANQVRERVRYDIFYVENWSFLLDLKILALTPISVLLKRHNAF